MRTCLIVVGVVAMVVAAVAGTLVLSEVVDPSARAAWFVGFFSGLSVGSAVLGIAAVLFGEVQDG